MSSRPPRATRSSARPRPASPPAPAPSCKRRKTARAASQQPVPQPEPQPLAAAAPPPPPVSHPVICLDGQPLYPDCHAAVPYANRPGALAPHLIRIVTWNVCSLRSIANSGAFASYVERERPHILCLQETKMNAEVAEAFDPPAGYDVFWNHSQSRKGYSGVAVFMRTDIICTNKGMQQDGSAQPDDTQSKDGNAADSAKMLSVVSVDYAIGDAEADAEGRIITVRLQLAAGEVKAVKKKNNDKNDSKKHFCLVVAYVPNAGGKLARLSYRTDVFERKMRDYLKSLADQNMSVIYCGDLNVAYQEIDIHNSKSNKKSAGHTPEERKAFGELLEHGPQWIDCYRALWPDYRGFTYFSRRFGTHLKLAGKGWRLDYFLVDRATYEDKKLRIADCFVRPEVEGSDHYPLVLDIDLNK